MNAPKRVLVCGAGSIGRRHISNLLQLGVDVSVWRVRSELLSQIAHEFPVQVCNELSEGIKKADAVVVATATDQHIGIALETLKSDKALFIEKPLSHDWTGIDDLISLAKGKTVEVGFQFRSHPNLIALAKQLKMPAHQKLLTYRLAMGHRLDAWRVDQEYEKCYSSNSERGGGALFDLIHQIDIALWFFGPVTAVQAVQVKLSDLKILGDDVTNLLLTHKNGVTGHIQLDMASPINRCEVEVMTSNAVFRWTDASRRLLKLSLEGETLVDCLPEGFKRNNLFLNHMSHWVKRLNNPQILPMCAFEDGTESLKVAIAARRANTLKKTITI